MNNHAHRMILDLPSSIPDNPDRLGVRRMAELALAEARDSLFRLQHPRCAALQDRAAKERCKRTVAMLQRRIVDLEQEVATCPCTR
jgi:hypothetical protein